MTKIPFFAFLLYFIKVDIKFGTDLVVKRFIFLYYISILLKIYSNFKNRFKCLFFYVFFFFFNLIVGRICSPLIARKFYV